MRRAIVSAAALTTLAGCTSSDSGIDARKARYSSRSVPGLELELRELVDGEVYRHAPDVALPNRTQEVDTRSTLRMTFDAPPAEQGLKASPEWAVVQNALTELTNLFEGYRKLSADAAKLPTVEFEGTEAFVARVKEFAGAQQRFVNGLVRTPTKPGLIDSSELLPMMKAEGGLWVGFDKRLKDELARLELRAAEFTKQKDEILVTVRARLEPEVGPPQWLQVPKYWESAGGEPADVEHASSAELRKLRAEFAAAQDVAAMIGELRAKGAEVSADLESFLRDGRTELEKRWRELVDRRKEALDRLLAGEPAPDEEITPEERAFWTAVGALRSQLDASETKWRALIDAVQDGTIVQRIDELLAALGGLKEEVETLRTRAQDVLAAVEPALTALASRGKDDVVTMAKTLTQDLKTAWESAASALLTKLPKTKKALEDLRPFFSSGHQILAGIDALPENAGSAIPHPPDDLPKIDLDLKQQPITPGDKLRLEVAFYDRGEYAAAKAADKTPKPREVVEYTNDAIKSGWIWSGDVIFVKPLDGADHFEASAAVSYERHWRDREDPKSWLNKLDPGIGFHAAALNFDPNESTEFGVGVCASLFGGLLRGGVGYDISIDQDQEYWYFGFGLISALQQVKELGSLAFADD